MLRWNIQGISQEGSRGWGGWGWGVEHQISWMGSSLSHRQGCLTFAGLMVLGYVSNAFSAFSAVTQFFGSGCCYIIYTSCISLLNTSRGRPPFKMKSKLNLSGIQLPKLIWRDVGRTHKYWHSLFSTFLSFPLFPRAYYNIIRCFEFVYGSIMPLCVPTARQAKDEASPAQFVDCIHVRKPLITMLVLMSNPPEIITKPLRGDAKFKVGAIPADVSCLVGQMTWIQIPPQPQSPLSLTHLSEFLRG